MGHRVTHQSCMTNKNSTCLCLSDSQVSSQSAHLSLLKGRLPETIWRSLKSNKRNTFPGGPFSASTSTVCGGVTHLPLLRNAQVRTQPSSEWLKKWGLTLAHHISSATKCDPQEHCPQSFASASPILGTLGPAKRPPDLSAMRMWRSASATPPTSNLTSPSTPSTPMTPTRSLARQRRPDPRRTLTIRSGGRCRRADPK